MREPLGICEAHRSNLLAIGGINSNNSGAVRGVTTADMTDPTVFFGSATRWGLTSHRLSECPNQSA